MTQGAEFRNNDGSSFPAGETGMVTRILVTPGLIAGVIVVVIVNVLVMVV